MWQSTRALPAANILMNNQPNITRSMNNLENQLGCRLFIRSNRGVSLTPEGDRLFHHVSIAYKQLQMAESELGRGKSIQDGTVSIGASETALHELLLSRLSEFHTLFPGVHIRIANFSTPQAVSALKRGCRLRSCHLTFRHFPSGFVKLH